MPTAILIDPIAQKVSKIELDPKREAFHTLMPGGICVASPLANGDVLYVDDEGLLEPIDGAFRIPSLNDQPFPSRGLVLGGDSDDDDGTKDCTSTIESIQGLVEWMPLEKVREWLLQRAGVPASTITSYKDGQAVNIEVLGHWGDFIGAVNDRIAARAAKDA